MEPGLLRVATIAICGVGIFYVDEKPALGNAGRRDAVASARRFLDVLVSRIVLERDAPVIAWCESDLSASDLESAKVDGGAVCLKRREAVVAAEHPARTA